MIDLFSLERVNKSEASFDPKKLWAFQDRYMQQLTIDEKAAMTLPYLRKAGLVTGAADDVLTRLKQIAQAAGDRIKVAGDILDYADFFVPDDKLTYDDVGFEKHIRKPPEAAVLLKKFRDQLASLDTFDAASLEKKLHDFVQAERIGIGQIIHALRVAVTGKSVGFGVFDSLAILGKQHCLARIDQALKRS